MRISELKVGDTVTLTDDSGERECLVRWVGQSTLAAGGYMFDRMTGRPTQGSVVLHEPEDA